MINKLFTLPKNVKQEFFPLEEVNSFENQFGWFHTKSPLVSRVTESKEHIHIVSELLQTVGNNGLTQPEGILVSSEIITKVLAYRELKKGEEIWVPVLDETNVIKPLLYVVDEVIDLWQGMPAFGLVPKEEDGYSILLYRGTDASLRRKGSWFSLLSDLDFSGPGFTVFIRAQPKIYRWLEKVKKQNRAAVVMGFSLGGILSSYTILHVPELLSSNQNHASVAFSPPGVPKKLLNKWQTISKEQIPLFLVFISKNDLVSKTGYFFGDVYQLSTNSLLLPLEAHIGLMSAREPYYMESIPLRSSS